MHHETFNIAKSPKFDKSQRSWFNGLQFFDKKSSGGAAKSEIVLNQDLAEKLLKPIVIKFEKREKYSFLKTIFKALILLICN